jgi:prepilin-type N-terminal cleavage/methylation domain-containing protein
MKKGFTLIEVVVATGLILIIAITISTLNVININLNKRTSQKDEQLNIARGVCEKFKCETGDVSDKRVIIYTNGLSDMPPSITSFLEMQPNTTSLEPEILELNNLHHKRYALLIQSFNSQGVNAINVTVFYMEKPYDNLKFTTTRISEI